MWMIEVISENRDGHWSIVPCRDRKNANGVWAVVQEFIPLLVEIAGRAAGDNASPPSRHPVGQERSKKPYRYRERNKSIVEYGTSDIASF